jgi:hypothetical protein
MDIANLTLVGLIAIGTVNVITFFKADLDSRIKFAAAFVVAFIATFIPVDLGTILLNNAKIALEAALAGSGVYKLFQITK